MKHSDPSRPFAHVEQALEHMTRGGMIILVDDEDRENEGDLVISAQACTPEAINFMVKYGRGLVCLAMSPERIEQLNLPMMVPRDPNHMGTAFTVSIEAREGVSTGISAADRARTVQVAIDPACGPEHIASPGHIFPLRAKAGGVLVRSGHTEGAVDLARLCGHLPAGVICEIMRDDGEMARMDDLIPFAREHGLPLLTIADLIEYRLHRESLVQSRGSAAVESALLGITAPQGFVAHAFVSREGPPAYFVALVKGEPASWGDVLVRVQRASVLGDVFGFGGHGSGERLRAAIARIEEEGAGVLLYVVGQVAWDELDGAFELPADGPSVRASESGLREFGLGAQVLRQLGVRRMRLLSNSERKIIGLEGFGIEIVGTAPLGTHD